MKWKDSVQNQVWEFEKITPGHVTDLLEEQEKIGTIETQKTKQMESSVIIYSMGERKKHRTQLGLDVIVYTVRIM